MEGTIKLTETATQWVGRLLDTGHNCFEYRSTPAEVMDLFIMEHALRMLPSHIACLVRGHKPKTAKKKVGTWVDQYLRDRNPTTLCFIDNTGGHPTIDHPVLATIKQCQPPLSRLRSQTQAGSLPHLTDQATKLQVRSNITGWPNILMR